MEELTPHQTPKRVPPNNTHWNDLENPDLQKLFRRHLLRGLFFLALLVILIFVVALSFEPQIESASNWLAENFGLLGMAVAVFITDIILSPIPPDLALFFISRGEMHQSWLLYVPVLG